ncbi:MAG: ABC transporter substrate-binding protein [Burkholderiaceae bacterium]
MNDRRRLFVTLAAASLSCAQTAGLAQPNRKLWRVGYFSSASRPASGAIDEEFLAGMKDLGYEVGRNLIVDWRYAEGDAARYPALADELIALQPDVLLVSSTGNIIVMKSKTTTIPIVMGSPGDPVADGIVQSLARPGGNITGNSLQLTELSAKQIEMMGEVLPRMRRVVLLIDSSQVSTANERVEQLARAAASLRRVSLDAHRIDSPEAVRQAFRKLKTQRADALLLSPTPRFNVLRPEICQSAMNIRLAVIGFSDEWAEDGALMSFGPNWDAAYRRAAYFVDRIFKGAKPADLPVEQPTRFSMVINAKTARALGITFPGITLLRADRVIEE